MGLLDEAIRAHLELRRRHGVDPAVVAREEHDALAPVEREERHERRDGFAGPSAEGEPPAGAEASVAAGAPGAALFDGELVVDRSTRGGPEVSRSGDASFMEATAEIDMRSVLGELEHAMSGQEADGEGRVRRAVRVENATPVAAGETRSRFRFEDDEGSLGWETAAPRTGRIAGRTERHSTGGDLPTEAPGP